LRSRKCLNYPSIDNGSVSTANHISKVQFILFREDIRLGLKRPESIEVINKSSAESERGSLHTRVAKYRRWTKVENTVARLKSGELQSYLKLLHFLRLC